MRFSQDREPTTAWNRADLLHPDQNRASAAAVAAAAAVPFDAVVNRWLPAGRAMTERAHSAEESMQVGGNETGPWAAMIDSGIAAGAVVPVAKA